MPKPEGIALDQDGNIIQVLELGYVFKIDYISTSVQSTIIGATVVRLISTTDCYVEVGTNPTATASTSTLVPGMVAEYIKIGENDKIAAIRKVADGTLDITVVEHPLGLPALDLDFTKEEFDSRITFTRASNATYFKGNGVLKTAPTGTPRNNAYVFDGTNWINRGLLIEEARTNLLLRSEEFDNGVWTKNSNATVSANTAIAPDGNTTADDISVTSDTASRIQQQHNFGSSIDGITWVYTVWLRSDIAQNITIQIVDGATPFPRTKTFITTTTVWTRYRVVHTSSTTSITVLVTIEEDGEGESATVEAWGAQFEQNAFETSYIPTTTATVTRAADVATMATPEGFSSAEGTIYTEHTNGAGTAANQRIATISDGGISDRITILRNSSKSRLFVASGGASVADFTTGSNWAANTTMKHAAAWQANDFALSQDGASPGTDTAGNAPVGMNTIDIGISQAEIDWANGYIARVTLWNRRLSNQFLQDKTS